MPDYHERLEQAVEAAVREPLAGWKITEHPTPVAPPKPQRTFSLPLNGGLLVQMDDRFAHCIPWLCLSGSNQWFSYDADIQDCAREVPAKLLSVLKAAVADLERMVKEAQP